MVKIDASTSFQPINRYLGKCFFTKYSDKFSYKKVSKKYQRYQKVLHQKEFYAIQWRKIRKDLLFLPTREWSFRYAFGCLGLVLFIKTFNPLFLTFMGVVAFDAATSGVVADTTSDPATYSHTCTGDDRVLMVFAGVNGATTRQTDAVTYNAVSMILEGSRQTQATREATGWSLLNPASGANTVSVDWSGSGADLVLIVSLAISFTGANDVNNQSLVAVTGVESITTDVTSAVNNMVVDFILGAAAAVTAGAGQTERANSTNNLRKISTEAGGATVTMSWSWTGAGDGTLMGYNVVAGSQATAVNNWLLMGV